MLKKILILGVVAVLLAACLPVQEQANVQDQVNTAVAGTMQAQDQIERAVALTVSAQGDAQTDASNNTGDTVQEIDALLLATKTPYPTRTAVPTSTATPTKLPATYSCSAVTKKPSTNQVMRPNERFDIKWTITNTGNATWYDAADIKYYNGNLFALSNRAEVRSPLAPGQSFDVVLDAKAPQTPGYHFMAWMVEGGLCFAYVNIWVK